MLNSLKYLARLLLIFGAALTPTFAAHQARSPRGAFPRRAREAGRDEALYRRLKLRQAIRSGKVNLDRQGSSAC